MKVISSQHYIDWDTVEKKMAALSGSKVVEIPCYEIGEVDGEEYAIQADGHHTMAAARELGIEIRFVFSPDPEGLSGKAALDARWIDGDYYNIETSNPAYDHFDTIW